MIVPHHEIHRTHVSRRAVWLCWCAARNHSEKVSTHISATITIRTRYSSSG